MLQVSRSAMNKVAFTNGLFNISKQTELSRDHDG